MKTRILAIASLLFVGIGFTSCSNECVSCTGCDTRADTEICSRDFDNVESLYDAAIVSYESDNCTCVEQ